MALVSVTLFVPVSIVPPAGAKVMTRLERSSVKPLASCKVPPAKTIAPELPPMLAREEILTVPSLIVVW